MIKEKSIESAIFAVFPDVETFRDLKQEAVNQAVIDSFIDLAADQGLTSDREEASFIRMIRKNSHRFDKPRPPADLSFEELFNRKKELLDISLSVRALTERVNVLILKMNIALPKLTNTMLTRLKKEPADTHHKMNALRSLAFWLGYERPGLETAWTFLNLLRLCQAASPSRKIDKGVRIGLSLHSRGDVIGQDALSWLKKNTKDYIRSALSSLPYGGWGKVRSYDITTVYVDFPKEGEADFPASYQTGIRKALSVAHQIAVRWALSEHCTQNRFLSIGIATGEFANLNNYLLPMLSTKLPGDPVIRMSDYTHQCILVGDIRTVFCKQPREVTLFNDETLNIWWVIGLWSFIYWDFIPGLLTDGIMQPTPDAIQQLNHFLMYPDRVEKGEAPNAVKRFFQFPHNSLLGIEIAKTLYYRRSFLEANEILRVVLSIDPTNINARSLRMMLYRNLAVEESSYAISAFHFERAENEARFIMEHCNPMEEDFFCEYAVVSLSKAVNLLRRMRGAEGLAPPPKNTDAEKKSVLEDLGKAARLFEKGILVSPTGYRSTYLLICTHILTWILESDAGIFQTNRISVSVPKTVYMQKTFEILSSFNYFRWRGAEHIDYEFLEKILLQSFERHDNSGTLRAYQPTLHFCFAVVLWDMFPVKTVNAARIVLKYLHSSISLAKALEAQKLYIYSYTRCSGEMLEPAVFTQHIEKAIQCVEACAGSLDKLEEMDASKVIEDNENDFTLFSVNI